MIAWAQWVREMSEKWKTPAYAEPLSKKTKPGANLKALRAAAWRRHAVGVVQAEAGYSRPTSVKRRT